jgi:hypothetical protein
MYNLLICKSTLRLTNMLRSERLVLVQVRNEVYYTPSSRSRRIEISSFSVAKL